MNTEDNIPSDGQLVRVKNGDMDLEKERYKSIIYFYFEG